MEIWDIYDENGHQTGRTVIRGEKLAEGDYHLVVHIWIMNDKNEYLIQKRADHLTLFPGIWATTGPSLWTRSYFVSTAGNVSSETIKRYVEEQKKRG